MSTIGPNRLRGEVPLIVEGRHYLLIPTFRRLQHIEDMLQMPLPMVAGKIANKTIYPRELSVLVQCCIHPYCDAQHIFKYIQKCGPDNVMKAVALCFISVFGDQDG